MNFENLREENEEKKKEVFKQENNGYIRKKSLFKNYYQNIYFATKIYILWLIIHFTATQLYVYLCVPNTIIGLIISPFLISSPHCKALRWCFYNGANMIDNMWLVFGTWFSSKILIPNV